MPKESRTLIPVKTPLLNVFLVVNSHDEVVEVNFHQPKHNLPITTNHPYQNLVQSYFSGNLKELDQIKIKLTGSPFTQKVLRAMRQIPAGQTTSYANLAKLAGSPNASRAVGTICKNNPIPLIIPCHRVIRSNGQIGQYAFGDDLKHQLLTLEQSSSINWESHN